VPRPKVTLKDVAAKAGVSRATVSLVLRESPLVAAPTRRHVLATMKQLGYVYHRTAATLRSHRSNTVGLLVTDVSNPFFAELTAGVESELDTAGFVLLLGHNHESVEKQTRWLRVMQEYGVDGVLMCPAQGTTPEMLQSLSSARVPHVFVARYVEGHDAGYVAADYAVGARLSTEHLLSHGCRRIAFLGGPASSSAHRDRRRGVTEALAPHGQELAAELSVGTPTTRRGGYEGALKLLASADRPDGIVCFNDIVAFGVLSSLRELGLRAGRDVRIIGFDDIEEAAHQRPSLTTVEARPHELGAQAARLLNQLIENEAMKSASTILQPRLMVRESCGCPSGREE
jgi:LacI family transcriptional regulator